MCYKALLKAHENDVASVDRENDIIYASESVAVMYSVGVVNLYDHFKNPSYPTVDEMILWKIEFGVAYIKVQEVARVDKSLSEGKFAAIH